MSILDSVREDQKLWLADGKVIGSVRELYEVLKKMKNSIFSCHVNEEKNDFYSWVKEVFNDRKLADDLLWCTNKESMLFCLKTKIDEAERAKLFDMLPKGYGKNEDKKITSRSSFNKKVDETRERAEVLKELPRAWTMEKMNSERNILKKQSIPTDMKKIRKNLSTRKIVRKVITKKENFNKLQPQRIRKDHVHGILRKMKEVYGV